MKSPHAASSLDLPAGKPLPAIAHVLAALAMSLLCIAWGVEASAPAPTSSVARKCMDRAIRTVPLQMQPSAAGNAESVQQQVLIAFDACVAEPAAFLNDGDTGRLLRARD